MTENELRINGKSFDETISYLEEFMESDDVHGELFTVLRSARDFMENLNEEIQQYRAIGTVEEFKDLKEEVELYRNLDKTNFSDGYNKAIDEFFDEILNFENYIEPVGTSDFGAVLLYSGAGITNMIVKIKEQMKAGV